MRGYDLRHVQVGLQPRWAGQQIAGFAQGRQGGGQGRFVRVGGVLLVQGLGQHAECLGELGPGREIGPTSGQFESVPAHGVGLLGRFFQLLRARDRAGWWTGSRRGPRFRLAHERLCDHGQPPHLGFDNLVQRAFRPVGRLDRAEPARTGRGRQEIGRRGQRAGAGPTAPASPPAIR